MSALNALMSMSLIYHIKSLLTSYACIHNMLFYIETADQINQTPLPPTYSALQHDKSTQRSNWLSWIKFLSIRSPKSSKKICAVECVFLLGGRWYIRDISASLLAFVVILASISLNYSYAFDWTFDNWMYLNVEQHHCLCHVAKHCSYAPYFVEFKWTQTFFVFVFVWVMLG